MIFCSWLWLDEDNKSATVYFADVVMKEIWDNQNKILFLWGSKKFKLQQVMMQINTAIPAREVGGT